jgi:hypothetical protein
MAVIGFGRNADGRGARPLGCFRYVPLPPRNLAVTQLFQIENASWGQAPGTGEDNRVTHRAEVPDRMNSGIRIENAPCAADWQWIRVMGVGPLASV